MTPIQTLESKINEANAAYRTGNAIITDVEYDQLIEQLTILDPENELLTKVGFEVLDESRKIKLPIIMASLNKCKTIEGIHKWIKLQNIPSDVEFVLLPKYDGLSFSVEEAINFAVTRGDGVYGQRSDEHYKLIGNHLKTLTDPVFKYTYGEVMMSKKVFIEKYSTEFKNPRNLVAGLLNSKTIKEPLRDCSYIKYGGAPFNSDELHTKKDILDELNADQDIQVPYLIVKSSELTEELLINLFHKYSVDYEIDGLIIEVNDLKLQEKLGRETSSNNPQWARAFKHSSFEQSAVTPILGLSWNISKQGLLKPILHVQPIQLDGVTVSNVTGNNARFVKDMGLGIGAVVEIKRSGMVIPLITKVLEKVEFQMPVIEGVEIGWNDNEIELITLTTTDDQKLKQLISFFEILEVDNVGEGVVTQLWEAGYKTIKEILSLTEDDLKKIDRFGDRKAEIVYKAIHCKMKDVELSKLQHASGLFQGLGSKKLVLLEHFKEKPGVGDVLEIPGFSDISSVTYLDNYDRFFEFLKDLPMITVKKTKPVEILDNKLQGKSFCFSGFRDTDAESLIQQLGGTIASGVSKNTSYLVMKEKGKGSSKEDKAIEMGVKILDKNDLEVLLSI